MITTEDDAMRSLLSLDTFDAPTRWFGDPVIQSAFVPRRPGYLPYWLVITERPNLDLPIPTDTLYNVAHVCATGEAVLSSRYDIGRLSDARAIFSSIMERVRP